MAGNLTLISNGQYFLIMFHVSKNVYICYMRLSAILVIIVIMMQALIPCSDSFTLSADGTQIEQHLANSHDDTHKDIDQCGPFCECSCCATHTVLQHAVDFTFIQTTYKQRYTVYTQSEKLGVSASIWQPPRFVA